MHLRTHAAIGAAVLALPASATAAGLSVTGDDGQPRPLAEGQTVQLRHMTPSLTPAFTGTEGRYSLGITDPEGQPTEGYVDCVDVHSPQAPHPIDYTGNGTYTARLTTYADESDASCLTPTTTQTFAFVITAGTAVHAPASTLMLRKPDGDELLHRFSLDPNPGAGTYEVRWGIGLAFAPDGSIESKGTQFTPMDPAGELDFDVPGVYTVIARAAAGIGTSPWSAPVQVKLMAPFDFDSYPYPRRKHGSTYVFTGSVRNGDVVAGKRIQLSIAKGHQAFRPFGTARIRPDRHFAFTLRRGSGRYRIRYAFGGADLVAAGGWVQRLRLSRRDATVQPELTHVK